MRLSPDLLKAVVFLGSRNEAGDFKIFGTGFFVGYPMRSDGQFVYLVTADHIIRKIAEFGYANVIVRINLIVGGFAFQAIPVAEFRNHPTSSSIDVAAALMYDENLAGIEIKAITQELFLERRSPEYGGAGIGDEVFFVGCFVNHSGKNRNIPIARAGSISAMPSEPILTKLGEQAGYIVDGISIGGFSGAPVMVSPIVGVSLANGLQMASKETRLLGQRQTSLLGLVHGHFDIDESISDSIELDNRTNGTVNSGLAIVVPSIFIIETIEQEYFKIERDKHLAQSEITVEKLS